MRLIDADALLEKISKIGVGGMPVTVSKNYIQDLITNAPTVEITKLFEGYKAPEPLPVLTLTQEQMNTPFGVTNAPTIKPAAPDTE